MTGMTWVTVIVGGGSVTGVSKALIGRSMLISRISPDGLLGPETGLPLESKR